MHSVAHINPSYRGIRCSIRLRELKQCRSQSFGHPEILGRVENIREVKTSDYISQRFNLDSLDKDVWTRSNPHFCDIAVYTEIAKTECWTGAGFFCDILTVREYYKLRNDCSVF